MSVEKEKARARWDGSRWRPVRPSVIRSSRLRTEEDHIREISQLIREMKLTEVFFVGESVALRNYGFYHWMIPSRRLWYSKQIEFHAMHGRFPYDASRGGPP